MRAVLVLVGLLLLSGCYRDRDSFRYVNPDQLASCRIKSDYDINNPPTVGEIMKEYAKAVSSCRSSKEQIEAFKKAADRLKKA